MLISHSTAWQHLENQYRFFWMPLQTYSPITWSAPISLIKFMNRDELHWLPISYLIPVHSGNSSRVPLIEEKTQDIWRLLCLSSLIWNLTSLQLGFVWHQLKPCTLHICATEALIFSIIIWRQITSMNYSFTMEVIHVWQHSSAAPFSNNKENWRLRNGAIVAAPSLWNSLAPGISKHTSAIKQLIIQFRWIIQSTQVNNAINSGE